MKTKTVENEVFQLAVENSKKGRRRYFGQSAEIEVRLFPSPAYVPVLYLHIAGTRQNEGFALSPLPEGGRGRNPHFGATSVPLL